MDEIMANHEKDVRAVLKELREDNRRSKEGQYVYGGGVILWTHFEGGNTESSTGKITVNPEVGVAGLNFGVSWV